MSLQGVLRERVLSVIGILLIAIAADGILSPAIFVYSSPELGSAAPFSVSHAAVSQVVSFTDWPFYAPLLVGMILIALDAYYYFTKNKVRIG